MPGVGAPSRPRTPRVHDVEVRAAARTAQHRRLRTHHLVQRRTGQRLRRRCRTGRGRRRASSSTRHASTVVPATRKPPTSPGAKLGEVGHRMPDRLGGARGRTRLSRESAGIVGPLGSARRQPLRSTRSPARPRGSRPRRPAPASPTTTGSSGNCRRTAAARSTAGPLDLRSGAHRRRANRDTAARCPARRRRGVPTSCGCSPCTSSRLATRSSPANASASSGSAATAVAIIRPGRRRRGR